MLFSIKTCRLVALLSAHFTPAWGTWSAALKGKERTGTFPCLSAQPSGELMELYIQVLPGEVGLRQTSPVLPPGGGWGEETILICITGPIRCQSWCLLLGQRCSLMIGCNTEKNFVADSQHVGIWKGTLWADNETFLYMGKSFPYLNMFLWICFVLSFKLERAYRSPPNSQSPCFCYAKKGKMTCSQHCQQFPSSLEKNPSQMAFLQGSFIQKGSE